MELYQYQKEAVRALDGAKHIIVAPTGTGKTAMMMKWLANTGRRKVLVVTTPSKRDSGDMQVEADTWNGAEWRAGLDEFEVISWYGLAKWEALHAVAGLADTAEYAVAFDEVAKAGAGVSSKMGRAFLKITRATKCWSGYTATPGDSWIKFYAYFTACGLVENKTMFIKRYCNTQNYRGFMEITSYREEARLNLMWRTISFTVDSSEIDRQIPKQSGQVVKFRRPTGYAKVLKTKLTPDGRFLDTTMGLCMYLRQMCLKPKEQWLEDFIENLGTNAVLFVNFIEEEDKVCEIAKKVLPKGAKVWRIDGKHHEIPTQTTIGKRDIVVAHYASGGEALNLQFMNYMVFVSPNYSYSTSVQAKGRIRRIGQEKPQYYYYLQTEKTIEDDIYNCLKNKKEFSEDVWAKENNISNDNLKNNNLNNNNEKEN